MNRPSRTDEPKDAGYNQSPNELSNDLTTNEDLNGISNIRATRRSQEPAIQDSGQGPDDGRIAAVDYDSGSVSTVQGGEAGEDGITHLSPVIGPHEYEGRKYSVPPAGERSRVGVVDDVAVGDRGDRRPLNFDRASLRRLKNAVITFGKFVGPGMMIAVAYIDPGNYATDVAAGASYQYRLLFVVLLSNIFAIFLQSLSIKLGTVSGLNLAEACRAFLPRWMNYVLYFMTEAAIIATDIAEVIGTAIALNLLIPQLPLVGGCAISILDVMIILMFYQPNGSMRGLRAFELFVMLLVLGVVVCFCIQLSLIENTSVGDVFRGYLPSNTLVQQQALYQACGILGATVMPHSLYLGSGIVQSRLRDFDKKCGLLPPEPPESSASSTNEGSSTAGSDKCTYIPSLRAIRHSLKYSIAELAISLFTFALFVNSAILIVAGASLYNNPDAENADIFGIHDLLSKSIAPAAGTVFALALLLSGVSAGIVCTIAGQMVSEGALNWTLKPWLRRLVTRSISITPSIIIAGAVGREGLDAALNASQVALSIVLPFVTAPLIYFTARNRYMTVQPGMARFDVQGVKAATSASTEDEEAGRRDRRARWQTRLDGVQTWLKGNGKQTGEDGEPVRMANAWWVTAFGVVVWVIITAMNIANLVLLGQGN